MDAILEKLEEIERIRKTAALCKKTEIKDGKCLLCNSEEISPSNNFCQNCGATLLSQPQIEGKERLNRE